MIVYDITKKTSLPEVLREHASNGVIIRAVYDSKGMFSLLRAIPHNDGTHLYIETRRGNSLEIAYNAIHHHISIFSENIENYAKILGTRKFIIESMVKKDVEFLRKRLPKWNYVGITEEGYPRLELDLNV